MFFDAANFIAKLFWRASSQFDATPMSVTSHSHRHAQLQLYSTSAFLPFVKHSKSATSWHLPTRTVWFVRIQFVYYKLVRLQEKYNFIATNSYVQITYYNLVAPKLYVLVRNIQFDIYQFVSIKSHTIWMIPFCISYFTGRNETYNLTSTKFRLYQISTIWMIPICISYFTVHTNWSIPTAIIRLPTRCRCPLRHRVGQ